VILVVENIIGYFNVCWCS